MTLDEFDQALTSLHIDLANKAGMDVRNRILARHGRDILKVRDGRCRNCWMKEHGRCGAGCPLYTESTDPVEVSIQYLSRPNNVSIFPFMCMYMIPVYEEITGQRDTMKRLARAFKRRWKRERGSAEELPSHL